MWAVLVPLFCLINAYGGSEWVARQGRSIQSALSPKSPASSQLGAKLESLLRQRTALLAEREGLSPQDQYAKWTKANRRLDKLDAELAALRTELGALQTAPSQIWGYLLPVTYYLVKFWGGNASVGYPARGLFPQPLESLLLKKDGALGLLLWTSMVCAVFGVVWKGVFALKALATAEHVESGTPGVKSAVPNL